MNRQENNEGRAPTYRDVLAFAPFRRLWLGQAISQLGDSLYFLVFLFMADRLGGGDSRLVGLVGIVQTLPFVLLSPFTGVIADRADRRRIMLFADTMSATALGLFAVLLLFQPTPPAWLLLCLAAMLSCVNAFFLPAKSAALPSLVSGELLTQANSLSAATQSVMPLLGVGLSASVLSGLYAAAPKIFFVAAVLLNAISFGLSALFIRALPRLVPDRSARDVSDNAAQGWRDFVDGVRYVRQNSVLTTLLVCGTLVQFAIGPFMVVYIAANRQWFGGGFGTLAWFEFAFTAGMVAGSIWVGRANLRRPGVAFIAGLALVGLCIAGLGLSRTAFGFVLWNVVAGIALPFSQVPINTYVQATVPSRFLGRVNAALTAAGMAAQPLAIGLGGIAVRPLGPGTMLLLMGIGMILIALGGLCVRDFRRVALPGGKAAD